MKMEAPADDKGAVKAIEDMTEEEKAAYEKKKAAEEAAKAKK